jgi:hypothetical protein
LHGLCKTISFPCESYLVHSQRHTCAAQSNQKNPPSVQEGKRSPAMYAVYFRKHRRTDSLLLYPHLHCVCRQLRACSAQATTPRYPFVPWITSCIDLVWNILSDLCVYFCMWNRLLGPLPYCRFWTSPLLNQALTHTHASRWAGSIFARWNVGTPCGGCTLVFSGCVSLRTEGASNSSVGWSACGTQAARKRGDEEGRAFEHFGSLDRWTRSIRSFAVLVGSFLGVWWAP